MAQFFSPNGKLSRSEFLMHALIIGVIWMTPAAVAWLADRPGPHVLNTTPMLRVFFADTALCGVLFLIQCVKRFHDLGRSGWECLWFLLPSAAVILLLVLFVKKGQATVAALRPVIDSGFPKTR